MTEILYAVLAVVVGVVTGALLFRWQRNNIIKSAEIKEKKILKDARKKSDQMVNDSQRKSNEVVESARKKYEASIQAKRDEAQRAEKHAKDIEKNLIQEKRELQETKDRAESAARKAEIAAAEHERLIKSVSQTEEHYKNKVGEINREYERIASMTEKEARESLLKSIEEDTKLSAARMVREIEESAKEEAEKLAKRVISIAVSRYASDYIPERTTSSIHLPSDELKGRLIGREGRNIRAIEAATGCDLIVDDTPETVVVSCFDPVRRHIGKTVLEQLIADGRIHPARVEELLIKVTKNVNKEILEAGKDAILELGIVSMHPELLKVIGQLKFRYSYTQNQYQHVIEVGHLCGVMASELGLDVKKARRAGLLHDIGKALTHEVEGSHAVIGADLCEKYGEAPDIVYAIRAHHEDVKPQSWLDFMVISGDAISGARPGARREQLDNYIRRLQDLENIAGSFPGVERSFAIAAGREIRVMVENSRVNDEAAIMLSKDIAKKIESDMTYPGQIKVTVIRETRATTLAK